MTFPYLHLSGAFVLFFAALLGGALNAVAGGGSFIAFPALLFTGVPPVAANATNTVAMWSGLMFSGGAFRHHLKAAPKLLIPLVSVCLFGGAAGAWLLIRTPAHTFLRIVPWLMLSATLLFIFGGKPAGTDTEHADRRAPAQAVAATSFLLLPVAVYGGYFGGGMSIVILALLAAVGMAEIHQMNALKTVLSAATNGVAVLVFIVKDAVYWPQALIMICGAALGGYFGAHYSLLLPRAWVRGFVIAVGASMTAFFFARTY